LLKSATVLSIGGLVVLGASSADVNGVSSNQVVLDDVAQQQLDQHISEITGVESGAAVASTDYDTSAVSKQQIIETNDITAHDILTHTVKDGESIEDIARDYGVNVNTIKWANELSSDTVALGDKLLIPPVDGVIHTVKNGDTVKKLAKKYNATESDIIAFNDAEIDGLTKNKKIVIPNGTKPDLAVSSPTYASAGTSSYSYSPRPSYGSSYNYLMHYSAYASTSTYSRGWCTDWAAYRATQLGNPIGNQWGNANTWDSSAAAAGYYVGSKPKVGAVFQSDYGWAGHVGVVEAVSSDGTRIKYSDMNGLAGWGNAAVTKGWVSAAGYDYIYR